MCINMKCIKHYVLENVLKNMSSLSFDHKFNTCMYAHTHTHIHSDRKTDRHRKSYAKRRGSGSNVCSVVDGVVSLDDVF